MKPNPPRSIFVFVVAFTTSMAMATLTGCPQSKDNASASASAKTQATPTLSPIVMIAPTPLAPEKDAALHGYPRTLNFQWSEVPGATSYGIEIDCYGCGAAQQWSTDAGKPSYIARSLTRPAFTFLFWGDQPGRWRVWAANDAIGDGPKSVWRQFTFGPVIEGSIIPPPPPPIEPGAVVYCSREQIPVAAGPGITAPRVTYHPDPEYTDAARKKKLQGNVALRVDVGDDGLVKDVCVLRGTDPGLDERAVSTIKRWRFEPARKDGVAIPYVLNVEVGFSLR